MIRNDSSDDGRPLAAAGLALGDGAVADTMLALQCPLDIPARAPRWIAAYRSTREVRPDLATTATSGVPWLVQVWGLSRTLDQVSDRETLALRVQPNSSARFQMLSRLMSALLPLG